MENGPDIEKNAPDISVENRHTVEKNTKSFGREKLVKYLGVGLTESEFKLYSGLAEILWKSGLIKASTLYYFSKYAMKSLTELALATDKVALEQAKAVQGAQK